ncbi:MAG: hypothetical protein SFX19_01255 [Alphaproteobacteria bacterium]|nr:hypothetical protein [Alphaproteobacteria bacterium]
MASRIICPKCQYVGPPVKKRHDTSKYVPSGWVVVPMNIALLGFGGKTIAKMMHSIGSMFRKVPACSECGNSMLIHEDSAVGKRLIQMKYRDEANVEEPPEAIVEKPAPRPAEEKQRSRAEQDRNQF